MAQRVHKATNVLLGVSSSTSGRGPIVVLDWIIIIIGPVSQVSLVMCLLRTAA